MIELEELLARWDSNEGKPYKGRLIDRAAHRASPGDIGCMCAQGQVLALYGGWDAERLFDTGQREADAEVARLLGISRAHAILLRIINDKADGAPSIVLTDPGKVLGGQWSKLLDFWWMFDQFDAARWSEVATAMDATWATAPTAGDAAWDAAWDAAGDAAWDAAGDAAAAAVWDAAGDAAAAAVWDAAGAATWDIQGFELFDQRGRDVFFLPMFGIKSLDDIPARPADYGKGVVSQ